MAKATDGTEHQDSSQEAHKGVTAKQKDGKDCNDKAAGGSDAEFEKLLSKVSSTLSLLHL